MTSVHQQLNEKVRHTVYSFDGALPRFNPGGIPDQWYHIINQSLHSFLGHDIAQGRKTLGGCGPDE
jgi:hypothetical protein